MISNRLGSTVCGVVCCRSAGLPLNEERLGAEVVAGRGERGILYPDFPRNRNLDYVVSLEETGVTEEE